MRALLTGVSSFTGCWFAAALAEAGWEVVGTCRRSLESYQGLSAQRLGHARDAGCELVAETSFGDDSFLRLIAGQRFDLLCHHGAEVGDFRRADYDPFGTVAAATANAGQVLRQLLTRGGRAIVVTGTVFEPGEAGGTQSSLPVNLYGLAKHLIWETIRFEAARHGLGAARFVVPHPFGPLDKPGLVDQSLRAWIDGKPAMVAQPALVRDFIHVDYLAAAYAAFCREQLGRQPRRTLAPTGRIGALGIQLQRLAREMMPRLGVACRIEPAPAAPAGDEPLVRVNSDPLPALAASWSFDRSWNRLASFYL